MDKDTEQKEAKNMKQIFCRVDEDTHARLFLIAKIILGRPMKDVVTDAVKDYVDRILGEAEGFEEKLQQIVEANR